MCVCALPRTMAVGCSIPRPLAGRFFQLSEAHTRHYFRRLRWSVVYLESGTEDLIFKASSWAFTWTLRKPAGYFFKLTALLGISGILGTSPQKAHNCSNSTFHRHGCPFSWLSKHLARHMDNGPLPDQRSIPSPVWTNDFACERASLTPARLLAACWAWSPGLAVAPLAGWLQWPAMEPLSSSWKHGRITFILFNIVETHMRICFPACCLSHIGPPTYG